MSTARSCARQLLPVMVRSIQCVERGVARHWHNTAKSLSSVYAMSTHCYLQCKRYDDSLRAVQACTHAPRSH
jgi:hypothetical protein